MNANETQRLKELQHLTQSTRAAPRPLPQTSGLLDSSQRTNPHSPDDEPTEESPAPTAASDSLPKEDEDPSPFTPTSATGRYPFPPLPQVLAADHPSPVEIARQVQQTASTTLSLRDQREFKLSLEEDNSRDEALIDRLAEQTVSIVQQRDETLYQRVMQAIEQRLGQGRTGFP